jgi:Asp-tRNA(Asn)/Glu-tRNA(Gln) amidotransferase A subunit family amidase
VRSALARLDDVAARTGCVADRDDGAVLVAAAAAPDGVLGGEPVTVKDWIDVTGFRCSGGSVDHADRRPADDATVVARLRAAGAVVVAKSAVQVDSERFGTVRNPHDPARSPGASSSGDGAAVGGGAVRLGIGSDSGGSVRVPAAWCRVVGMKPSAGLVPTTGHFPRLGERSDGRTVIGPLASSVDLAWLAVRVMAGPDGADGGVAPVALGDPDEVDVSTLRIAVGSPGGAEVDAAVTAALAQAGDALRDTGAPVGGSPPDWLGEARRVTEAYWDRVRRTGAQVEQDLFDWDRFRRRILLEADDVDVVVTPTVAEVAPLHRAMRTDDYLFCLPASLTGAPAITVPVGDGAVQVIARRWADHVAVAVARVLEAAERRS